MWQTFGTLSTAQTTETSPGWCVCGCECTVEGYTAQDTQHCQSSLPEMNQRISFQIADPKLSLVREGESLKATRQYSMFTPQGNKEK